MAIGLKTHQWENDAKSILLLLAFPFLLLLLFGLGCLAVSGFLALQTDAAGYIDWRSFDWPAARAQAQGAFFIGAPIVLGIAGLWVLIAFFFQTTIINSATGARPVTREQEPELYNLLENLCISRGCAMPKLQIMETPALNAYASGLTQDRYAVSVTRGLVNTLHKDELETVLAHELAHIINHDVRLLVIVTVFVGMLSFLAEMLWRSLRHVRFSHRGRRSGGGGIVIIMLLAILLLWIGVGLGWILRFALSQKREFLADAGAVELTKNPTALASALRKISGNSKVKNVPPDMRSMFIDFPAPKFNFLGLFSTHPPIEDRLAALVLMGAEDPAPESPGPWG